MSQPSTSAVRERHRQNRRKRQLMVLLPLVALLGVLAAHHWLGRGPRQAAGRLQPTAPTPAPDQLAAAPVRPTGPPLRVALAAGPGRNLFDLTAVLGEPEPIVEATPPAPEPEPVAPPPDPEMLRQRARERLDLQALMVNAQPRAVINGQTRSIGDRVDGWQLTAIYQHRVILSKDGLTLELNLNEE